MAVEPRTAGMCSRSRMVSSMVFSIICALLGIAAAVGTAAWYSVRREARGLRERLAAADEHRVSVERSLSDAREEAAAEKVRADSARLQLERERQTEAERRESLRTEFRAMAAEVLEEKTRQIGRADRESLEMLLKPFRENMEEFRRRVEQLNAEGSERHGALGSQLRSLMELNRRITAETESLTAALRGNSKVQGDFGEMILESILEQSQLRRGVHFTVQESLRDEQGGLLRPDVILRLPEGKRIIIDSKVSLTAYVDYVEAADDALRESAMRRHILSVRKHIAELADKNYQGLLPDTPDFVVMFLANEAAFLSALEHEPALWEEAYRQRVIISSPTNLFAVLKLVDDLWKRDDRNRHALRIAEEGGRLYDKFVLFLDKLSEVERNITRAADSCREAMGQLNEGRGNLIRRADNLRQLGAKASKQIPARFAEPVADGESAEDALPVHEETGPQPEGGRDAGTPDAA